MPIYKTLKSQDFEKDDISINHLNNTVNYRSKREFNTRS